MDVILVPGFWLDGSSWDGVVPSLEAAGHTVRALTLPGLESARADHRTIRLRDHVDAVVAAVDEAGGTVVLVGHSGGGPIANGALDARPGRVARIIYVDSFPAAHGRPINDEMTEVDGGIPLPAWEELPEEDLRDLDDELRRAFRARAVPEPARVACDPQVLTDERRHDVPATVIACEFTEDQLRGWMASGSPAMAELAAVRDLEVVELPTGHWPQFTRPGDLARVLVEVIDRRM
ncbi:MAG TPA: alpha/beta hydrolase [Acidimicrobiales bacterium]|nr:alpha/beta hydrolase [Acidimicrobiales bacterium]